MNIGYALSQGVAGAAGAASGLLDEERRLQQQMDAEQRAADTKLKTEERLLAIKDAMNNRAAERFSSVARNKMGEQVPQEAAPVTSLSADSAKNIGLQDGIQGDKSTVNTILRQAKDTLLNPTATDEQKANARGVIDQMASQAVAQADINAKEVEGKTRNRTFNEAIDAARQETALNDPVAFKAGEGMFAADRKAELEEKKLGLKERLAAQENDRKERADNMRYETLMARIEASAGGKDGKSDNKTALIQNAEYLKSLGYSEDKIEKFIFEKKEIPLEDVAAKILAGDKYGEMTPEQAAQKAIGIRNALSKGISSQPPPGQTGTRPPLSSFAK